MLNRSPVAETNFLAAWQIVSLSAEPVVCEDWARASIKVTIFDTPPLDILIDFAYGSIWFRAGSLWQSTNESELVYYAVRMIVNFPIHFRSHVANLLGANLLLNTPVAATCCMCLI